MPAGVGHAAVKRRAGARGSAVGPHSPASDPSTNQLHLNYIPDVSQLHMIQPLAARVSVARDSMGACAI